MENAEAKLIRADGTEEVVKPANGSHFTLAEMQKFVGGYIELSPLRTAEGHELYLNEEGKLNGLPINSRATEISGLYPHDIVVGDVLVGHPNVFREEEERE